MARPAFASPTPTTITLPASWAPIIAIGLPTGLALALYWWLAAPGLTWAHYGADGGDLLVAAVTNGVPHPSGYPLYTLLLRGWLWLGHLLNPDLESAYWGNRLSALCMAGATGFTVATVAALLREARGNEAWRWLWAELAALLFAITPIAWSQALITEVYALHALLVAALGWAALAPRFPAIGLGVLMGLAAAHHLTALLLWPALLYWRLHTEPRTAWFGNVAKMVVVALVVAAIFYGGLVWRVATASTPLPIAWGNPRDLAGLWWLVSGAPYRAYLFGMTLADYAGRLATLARLLVEQFTPVGLALVIVGFATWDRQRPHLRNGAILWCLPISLYAAGYNTVDSYIYLLPVVWLMSVMAGEGLASASTKLGAWYQPPFTLAPIFVAALALVSVVSLGLWRLPQFDLRQDRAAQEYLIAAASTLEAGSLVISSADVPTFTLWYGAWGSDLNRPGVLARAVPDLIFVNHALYQFGWYRNLLHDLYPEVPRMGDAFADLIDANRAVRPIYFTEPLAETPAANLPQVDATPSGAFWRLDVIE